MHLPLTTPFHLDGRLNPRKLEENVARYSKTPAAGLVALHWTGQPSLLSDIETREVLQAVAGASAAEKVLTAGIARDSVAGTLELLEYAALQGYDVGLLRTPSFLREPSGRALKELQTYFGAVADRSPLPLAIWSEGLHEALIVELAGHPQVLGAVECGDRTELLVRATASIRREVTVTAVFAAVTARMTAKAEPEGSQFVAAESLAGGAGGASVISLAPTKIRLKTRTKAVGFQVLSGRTAGMLEALQAGAVGAMPAFAASAPQACYEVLAAWKDGDPALAAEKQERLRRLTQRVEEELGVAGIKYGSDLTGYFGGRPRLPGLSLTGAERAEVEEWMQGIRS